MEKIIKNILPLFVFMTLSVFTFGQQTDTTAIEKPTKAILTAKLAVAGVCPMCKKRIETAARSEGVRYANWNLETDTLQVVYRADKISLDQIHQNIAAAGHRTGEVKADKEAYAELPGCCKYDSGVKKHYD